MGALPAAAVNVLRNRHEEVLAAQVVRVESYGKRLLRRIRARGEPTGRGVCGMWFGA
jgi:hypothetical protein